MRIVTLPLPKLGFVVATRAALAVGVGLLLAGRLTDQQRRRAGLALVAFGAATTIPAASWVTRNVHRLR
jgi:hypothetical protein